jgi:glutaredoxin
MGCREFTPGETVRPSTLYLVTQPKCAKCPAAKAVVEEAIQGTDVPLRVINLEDMDPDFEFRLLEEQVFIASTPTIIIENGGSLKVVTRGVVPSIEKIRKALEE